jgi:hypothetical protein
MCGAPECLPAFGARTFSTVITTSVVQDLNEKIACVDYPLRCTYRSRARKSMFLLVLFLKTFIYGTQLLESEPHCNTALNSAQTK